MGVKKKTPSALVPADLPKTHYVRQQAVADYVTDPENRDPAYHYHRSDREYADWISFETFQQWRHEDDWDDQRNAYWAEAQRQLLERSRDQTVATLLKSMKQMDELRTFALEWCEPLRDPVTDEVLRYPELDDLGRPHRFAGKPMLPVRPGSYERAVAAALALDEAVRARRDEVLRLTGHGESASKPEPSTKVQLSKEDLRAMGRELVKRRQPELVADTRPEEEQEVFDES
jgi:hypothetical protein